MKFFSIAALCAFLLAPRLLAAQSPTWQPIGPYGGTVGSLAVHPTKPGVLYAAGSPQGVLKSTDGGLSWQILPGSPNPSLVVMDPTRPDTLYAVSKPVTNKVYRSTDAGAHWAAVSRNLPDSVRITRLVVDPARPVRLYAAALGGEVWRSGDSGATWRSFSQGLPSGGFIGTTALAAVPGRLAGTAFAGSFGPGLFRTRNAGLSWERVQGLPDARVTALALAPRDARVLYVSLDNNGDSAGIYRSENGGDSWVPAGDPVAGSESPAIRTLAVHPRLPFTVYAGTSGAIFKTTDGGRHWAPTAPLPSQEVLTLAFGMAPPVLYAGTQQADDPGGVLRSADAGASWTRVDRGFPGIPVNAVTVDPADADILVAAAGPGIVRSADRGVHWAGQLHVGAPYEIIAGGPGTFYFVEGGIDFRRAVWKSSDAGVTWGGAGLAYVQRTSLSADPLDPNTLYGIYNYYSGFDIHNDPEIYRSQDGGTQWASLADLPNACSAFDLAVARTSAAPAVLYLSGSRPGGECRASVWRSPDGGTTWVEAAAGLPGPPGDLAVDAQDSRVVYGRLGDFFTGGPLWRSTDSGASWQLSGLGQRAVTKMAASPLPGVVWAYADGAVYRSRDHGATWQKRGDLTWGVRGFAFDPVHPERVYAATSQGVWVLEDRP